MTEETGTASSARRRRGRGSPGGRWLRRGVLLALVLVGAGSAVWLWPSGRAALERAVPLGLRPPGSAEATLYFADARWTRLVPEVRRLPPRDDEAQWIRALVEALVEGPRGDGAAVLPRGARLKGAYLGRDGLAVIDFDPSLDGFDPGGASGELLTVLALVHTISENVPGVRSLQILVDGQERDTLAGHVKISEPLPPDPQRAARPGQ